MAIQIIQADARHLPLPDSSVDLIITSPPYFSMRHYQDRGLLLQQIGLEPTVSEYLQSLWAVTSECYRVLKPTGSLFFNLMDKYNSAASNQNGLGTNLQGGSHESNRIGRGRTVPDVPTKSLIGIPWKYALGLLEGKAGGNWILRSDMIWHKSNAMPDPTADRARRTHEYIFHFTKQSRYFANPAVTKLISSVWEFPTQPSRLPKHLQHPAPFPLAMPTWLIRGFCPPQGVVLDPFGGSGTTALAAQQESRHGISVDLSETYCETARVRCGLSPHPFDMLPDNLP